MYRAVTRQIEVTVEPNFMPQRSSPERSEYFWSYTIVITNAGDETVQLQTRHWIITDASGRKREIRGAGVVGERLIRRRDRAMVGALAGQAGRLRGGDEGVGLACELPVQAARRQQQRGGTHRDARAGERSARFRDGGAHGRRAVAAVIAAPALRVSHRR